MLVLQKRKKKKIISFVYFKFVECGLKTYHVFFKIIAPQKKIKPIKKKLIFPRAITKYYYDHNCKYIVLLNKPYTYYYILFCIKFVLIIFDAHIIGKIQSRFLYPYL